ncbi:MAG TPA: hypothetical protein V6D11_31700 [Waterburya sp.]|jgi:hypothetical protein
MASNSNIQLLIDLTKAGQDLEPEALEELTSQVVEEIRGELVDDAELVRESEIPELGKPALGGFILGVLKTEVSLKNAQALLSYLGERFYGKPVKIVFERNGNKYSIEYGSKAQLEEAIQAIERLAKID